MKSIEVKVAEKYFDKLYLKVSEWMARYGLIILRIGLGIVFL